jgi:hypothetical protein
MHIHTRRIGRTGRAACSRFTLPLRAVLTKLGPPNVCRIGRTGRAGARGCSLALVTPADVGSVRPLVGVLEGAGQVGGARGRDAIWLQAWWRGNRGGGMPDWAACLQDRLSSPLSAVRVCVCARSPCRTSCGGWRPRRAVGSPIAPSAASIREATGRADGGAAAMAQVEAAEGAGARTRAARAGGMTVETETAALEARARATRARRGRAVAAATAGTRASRRVGRVEGRGVGVAGWRAGGVRWMRVKRGVARSAVCVWCCDVPGCEGLGDVRERRVRNGAGRG